MGNIGLRVDDDDGDNLLNPTEFANILKETVRPVKSTHLTSNPNSHAATAADDNGSPTHHHRRDLIPRDLGPSGFNVYDVGDQIPRAIP
jgi:hypothetical protein